MVVVREPSTTVRLTPHRMNQWRRETQEKCSTDYQKRWIRDPSAQTTRNRFRQALDPATLQPVINTTLRWSLRRDFIGRARKQQEDEEAIRYWHAKHHPPRAYMSFALGDGPTSVDASALKEHSHDEYSTCDYISIVQGRPRATSSGVSFLQINRYLQGKPAMNSSQKRTYTEQKIEQHWHRARYFRDLELKDDTSALDDTRTMSITGRPLIRSIPPHFSDALRPGIGTTALEKRLELINRRRKFTPLSRGEGDVTCCQVENAPCQGGNNNTYVRIPLTERVPEPHGHISSRAESAQNATADPCNGMDGLCATKQGKELTMNPRSASSTTVAIPKTRRPSSASSHRMLDEARKVAQDRISDVDLQRRKGCQTLMDGSASDCSTRVHSTPASEHGAEEGKRTFVRPNTSSIRTHRICRSHLCS